MTTMFNQWSLVPESEGVNGYGGDQAHSGAISAKTLQRNGPGQHPLLSLCTYNTRTLKIQTEIKADKPLLIVDNHSLKIINVFFDKKAPLEAANEIDFILINRR